MRVFPIIDGEHISIAFDLSSPELTEDELYDLAVSARREIVWGLRAELGIPDDIPGDQVTVEVSRGTVPIFVVLGKLAYHSVVWLGKQAAATSAGEATVAVALKAPGVIKKVLGKKAKEKTESAAPPASAAAPPAAPPQIVINNYFGDRAESANYDEILDWLAGLDDAALEAFLAGLPEALRGAVREDVLRRRGMGRSRQPVGA